MHRCRRSLIARLIVLGAFAVADSVALAQGITGSAVTGTVRDPDGAPVSEATVQLQNTSTGQSFSTVTDASGKYFIDNVPPGGPYVMAATAPGYETTTREAGIQLGLGQRLSVDLPLRYMGEPMEILSHADALDDHARTGASTRVKDAVITRLPLQGRNFTDLVATDPRVSGNSFAGQNNRFNNIQIDGGANNDLFGLAGNGTPGGQAGAKPLSIEAVREFVVQIAPFDVRLGNFAGGLVNAITKSGTNDFHGTLFGYFQDKSLAGYRDDPKFNGYTTGQFGLAVGGPIIKNKAHFFIATDIQQSSSAFGNSFQIGGVDPVADRQAAGFDNSVAQRFIDILSTKYGITTAGNALAPSLANPDRNLFIKVDTSALENSNLEISYNLVNAKADVLIRAPTSPSNPTATSSGRLRDGYELSNSGYGQANTTNTVRAKLATNFDGGKLSNEFLGGISFIRDSRDLPANLPLILVKATCAACPPGSGKIGAADAWLAAGGERFSQANILDQDIYQLQDNITYAYKDHRFTAGTSNEFFKFRNVFLQAAIGAWSFDSLDALAAGTPTAFQRRFGASSLQDPGTAKFNVAQLGFYLQDEWSVLRNLTVTPGIRFDVPFLSSAATNPTLANNAAFPIDTSKVPSGNVLWSPRLGFNWDVEGNSDTILRGGVGIFSGRPPYVWVSNAYSINGLSQVELTCVGASGVPAFTVDPNAQPSDCRGGTGTPPPPTNVGEVDYFDPKTKYPQNLRVALGADRRLPFGIVGTFDFLYTRDVNGWYISDDNLNDLGKNGEGREVYGTFATTGTGNNTRLATTTSRVDPVHLGPAVKVENLNGGYVTNATFQLQKQFGQTYGVTVGYTYSRSYDRISFTSSQAFSNFQFAPLDGDIYGRNVRPSAFDRPHRIVITGTANLPYGFGVGLSYSGQSGTPYTWTVAGDVNGDGVSGNDLVYVPNDSSQITLRDPTQYAALDNFIKSQDCLQNARGGFIQRGACRNPWNDFVDLRLTWTSPAWKDQRIEVQWDIFNVLNLISSSWGHYLQTAPFESATPFLSAVGYDAANKRPIYLYAPPPTITSTIYSPTASRWRMQLGARYLF
jgi:hypothetical protein